MKTNRLSITAFLLLAGAGTVAAQDAPVEISSADTGWLLISTALVLLMTPALAFFYGGLVRTKNALNTMMMSFVSLGIVGILWAVAGYSIAFSPGTSLFGGLSLAFLEGVGVEAKGTIPHILFMGFQGTFAIITAALISGAIVERMKFSAYVIFISLWSLLVYAPVAHWVWGGGWLGSLGALDFAGGAVVHVNAAAAAVVAALVLGVRKDYGRQATLPHHVPFVLLGSGLLWFGWFGFNGGSALASNGIASLAFVNTMFAPAATLTAWVLLDYIRTQRVTAVGAATGIVVGLVAITPAAGFVSPMSAVLIGAIAAFPSYYTILWRARTRFDDSLDVFAAHGMGGITGALLTGVFADQAWNGLADGLLYGNPGQLGIQALSLVAVFAYSALGSFAILKLTDALVGLRVTRKVEGVGMDVSNHGEEAYTEGEGAILVLNREVERPAEATAPSPSITAPAAVRA